MAAAKEFTLSGERDEITMSLQHPCRVTGKGNDAVKNVRLFKAPDGEQFAESTNLVQAIRTHMWGVWDVDEVDLLVPPAIRKVVSAMPAGEVTLAFKGPTVTVTGKGKSRYSLNLPDSAGWPKLQWAEAKWDGVAAVDVADILGVFETAAKFANRSENKPAMHGVNVRVVENGGGKELVVSATDTFRLYRKTIKGADVFGDEDATIPLSMVGEMIAMFPNGKVKIFANQNLFFVSSEDATTHFYNRRISQPYPAVDRLIPQKFDLTISFEREAMANALDRIGVLAAKKNQAVAMAFKGGEVQITSQSDIGEGVEFCDCEISGDKKEIRIGFSPEYFASMLNVFKSAEKVSLGMISPTRPVIASDDEGLQFLLMPVRV